MKFLSFLLFGALLFVGASKANPTVEGEGVNGLYLTGTTGNIGFIKMTSELDHYHGERSVCFEGRAFQEGSFEVTKTLQTSVSRSSYMECIAFERLVQLDPPVSNVQVRTTFYISGDGINFCEVSPIEFGRGTIGANWAQEILPIQGQNPPAMVTAIRIKIELGFDGQPSNDSIRCKIKWDYWNFSSFSYPQREIDDFEGGITGIQNQNQMAKEFSLSQNYPNPFNPKTKIAFTIPQRSHVSLKVYDIAGREMKALVDGEMGKGSYEADFDASSLASGTYFYRLEAKDFVETKKMTVVK
jgi:hypothetical protein